MNEILRSLHGDAVLSVIDLKDGYFQVNLAKED